MAVRDIFLSFDWPLWLLWFRSYDTEKLNWIAHNGRRFRSVWQNQRQNWRICKTAKQLRWTTIKTIHIILPRCNHYSRLKYQKLCTWQKCTKARDLTGTRSLTSNCITKRRRPSNSKIYLFVSVKRRCHSQGAKKGFVKEVLRLLRINSSHSTFNNFTLTTTRLNLLLLKTLNYSKTIQRLALSFRNPPLVSFKRDHNIGNFLVRSSFQTSDQSGTFKCARSRCKTCSFIHNVEKISGPKRSIKITDHFTCTSANVIYCITCTYCNKLYIGETGRRH